MKKRLLVYAALLFAMQFINAQGPLPSIAITEWIASPEGDDTTNEWIEIYNFGTIPIDIQNWRIKDEDVDDDSITNISFIVQAEEYVILARNKEAFEALWFNGCIQANVLQISGINLSNGSDEIIIEDEEANVIWSVAYQNDETSGRATHYTETPVFTNRIWGTKGSPGVRRAGNDPATGTLGYEKNNVTADPLAMTSTTGDMGSPLNGTGNVAPIVTFVAPNDLCVDSGTLNGLSGGVVTGGVYSGFGVTDDGNGMTYSFDPAIAGIGEHIISYSVTNGNGCAGMATDTIEIIDPEIDVKGLAVSIANNDVTPDVADGTDFEMIVFGAYVDHTFTIENTGNTVLELNGDTLVTITGSTDFTIVMAPETTIAANGGVTNLTVRYTPSAAGTINTATLSIANNDCDEASYSFDVKGTSVGPISVAAKVYLQGAALNPNTGEETLMRDDLRVLGHIPTISPYSDNLTCDASVFGVVGNNAIVDWVYVELRETMSNTVAVSGQSALLQRDGDIVGVNGASNIFFTELAGNYHIVVEHRNHLGIMTATGIALSNSVTAVDFTSSVSHITYGVDAQTSYGMPSGVIAMWSGDANTDGRLSYSGGLSDVPFIRSQVFNDPSNSIFGGPPVASFPSEGYLVTDLDMNGLTIYSGASSDVSYIRNNIFNNPSNSIFGGPPSSTYVFAQQLPEEED